MPSGQLKQRQNSPNTCPSNKYSGVHLVQSVFSQTVSYSLSNIIIHYGHKCKKNKNWVKPGFKI